MAVSLLSRWLESRICSRALRRLDLRQGFFTARMCIDSVIEEHKPFGAPYAMMCSM